jgi:hypothetical protein
VPSKSPQERSLAATIGAYALHSKYDSRDLTATARARFDERFEHEVDPDRVLPEAERLRRAGHARKAYFARLALKSAKVRRARKAARA